MKLHPEALRALTALAPWIEMRVGEHEGSTILIGRQTYIWDGAEWKVIRLPEIIKRHNMIHSKDEVVQEIRSATGCSKFSLATVCLKGAARLAVGDEDATKEKWLKIFEEFLDHYGVK